jgi:hypothetical protein
MLSIIIPVLASMKVGIKHINFIGRQRPTNGNVISVFQNLVHLRN